MARRASSGYRFLTRGSDSGKYLDWRALPPELTRRLGGSIRGSWTTLAQPIPKGNVLKGPVLKPSATGV